MRLPLTFLGLSIAGERASLLQSSDASAQSQLEAVAAQLEAAQAQLRASQKEASEAQLLLLAVRQQKTEALAKAAAEEHERLEAVAEAEASRARQVAALEQTASVVLVARCTSHRLQSSLPPSPIFSPPLAVSAAAVASSSGLQRRWDREQHLERG